jgi:hypothetical protein
MTTRLCSRVVVAATVCAISAAAVAQQGGRGSQPPPATDRLGPPQPAPVGAWWHTGEAVEQQAGHPDLTGVWFGGASGICRDSRYGSVPFSSLYIRRRTTSLCAANAYSFAY